MKPGPVLLARGKRALVAHGRITVSFALAALGAAACGTSDPRPKPAEALVTSNIPGGFPARSSVELAPAGNALTEARATLGRRLFFDTRLSRTNRISCSSCHQPEFAFSDPRPVSVGVDERQGTRNAPALVNEAWGTSFFWDGRASSLEEQAGQPIENPDEMGWALSDAVASVSSDAAYRGAFQAAYGEAPSETTLRGALASFVRCLISANSPYDHHLRGDDSAFSVAAGRGEALFLSEQSGCFHCHPSGVLTDNGFFNDGTFTAGGDSGRERLSGRVGDTGKFKVPGLRNIAQSAPYMHDGSLPSLAAVIDQYDHGGRGDPTTDPQIEPLGFSVAQKADLLAFLNSLTDEELTSDPRFRAGASE